MQTDLSGGPGLAVVAGDVLALRGTGLAAAETWALLCQAAQALQDLFLSNGGVVGGSRAGPVVTPHTLELTPRGRVLLQLAPPETARAYLPPEYRPGRVYSDTDSEKMWMYSLGRALLDTTPRVAALTGTVSVSPSSALQSVLAAMTEPDPRRRASLMNLLDVISEYCRTRLQSKPFTHIVMDMYREVMKSPQYAARKRLAYQHLNPPVPLRNPLEMPEHNIRQGNYPHHHQQLDARHAGQAKSAHQYQYQDRPYHMTNQYNALRQTQQRPPTQFHPHQHHQRLQDPPQLAHPPKVHHYHHHHPAKGALFKLQSRNSHSHPNLPSLCGQQAQNRRQEANLEDRRTQFQSQLNVQANGRSVGPAIQHQRRHHSRTYSQPIYTRLQHTRSSGNLPSAIGENSSGGNVYSDPIYALPVKPFLSSQDVRVNGLSVKPPGGRHNEDVYAVTTITRRPSAAGYSHPDIPTSSTERGRDEVYGRSANVALQRQHSNPQLPSRNHQEEDFKLHSEQNIATADHRCPRGKEEQIIQQQNPVSSIRARSVQGPPKPPRIITTLKKAPFSDAESSKSEPPAKPPRNLVKNGPRARRGKAVQRAPSRLYRTVGGPMRSFNKAQCIGPEFVVRANQPPKTLCVGQAKTGNSGRIVVIMLTGQRVEVTCDPQKVTAGDLFQAIVQAESLDENFTLGLAVLLAGDFAILPPDTKLNKVAPPGWLSSGKSKGLLGLPTSFMLYLRLRFFLPSLRGIRSWISKHLLYLQIRRCILEQQLVCPYHELINLTGLALQAEFGNYNVNEHGCGDYFLLEHYVPESLILNMDQHQSQINNGGAEALRARLHQSHRDRRGLDSNKAEEMFITHAQTLPDYGSHYYIATVDSKELEKVMAQQRRRKTSDNHDMSDGPENIYSQNKQEYPLRGRVEITRLGSCENIPKISYEEKKLAGLMKSATSTDIYSAQKSAKCRVEAYDNNNVNNVNHNNSLNHGKSGKSGKKKTESNVWLAIHAQGLKLFERGGEPRERIELAQFQWKDIQTLSYSKSCLVVYSKVNGKRCKFKLRMDHRKSYFAFKLTSLHHQFFLRLRSELTSLQGLAKEFGVPTTMETKPSPSKAKSHDSKTKIAIANTVKNVQLRPSYAMQLEEYQNKENENPQKDTIPKTKDTVHEPGIYSSEEDALYAQVNVRLEPEGESRDTEDESERSLTTSNEPLSLDGQGMKNDGKLYNCPRIDLDTETECGYSLPKIMSSNDVDQLDKPENPEELYAAINKVGISRKNKFPVPEEVWDISDVKKSLHKVKTSSLPNYGTPRQTGGYRTPSLPRRLGVKMGTRAIYSSLVQKDTALTDDMESLSLKSDTESSIQSLSARSTESPPPEAYVLNADIRTDDETFHVTEDESMSASLAARLEELSFAEERILLTIKLERGHGGSIGLQVTEGNDGGVYVQAVSVGGSADMAGNVNKGDRIVAINGQNLLHLRYEDALKMLQSTSDTIELVLSQPTSRKNATTRQNHQQPTENNYLNDIRFDVSSEADTASMTNKWLVQRTTDVASVQNTSSAYSSAASSAMGNHNANNLYMADLVDNGPLKSANAESTSTPPVPPRRKKRKPKPAAIARSPVSRATSPNTALKKPDRKRLAPPPPPPRTARRVKPRQSEGRASNEPGTDHAEGTRNDRAFEETRNDSDNVTDSPRKPRLLFTKKETNKYPPLFFTLHDFQNVMSSTLQQEDDIVGKSAASLNNSHHESFENSLDDEENELCFRVTTTNLPFERCLDRWTATFADHFIDKFDESNRFIFEDYIDRSNKVNVRRSAGPMCYDGYEEEPLAPRLTKVRFVIESPSSSTPDDEEFTCDSLGNIDPLLDDEVRLYRGSSLLLTEITDDADCLEGIKNQSRRGSDEFGDVPFTSNSDSANWMSMEDVSNIIELGDQESYLECEITRNESRESFHSSSSQDLENDTLFQKFNIAGVGKAWLNLIKPKTECTVVLTEITDDFDDSNGGKDSSNENNNRIMKSTEEIQNDEEENVLNETNANVDQKEDNLETDESKLVMDETGNDTVEDLISNEVKNETREEEKLVTNEIEDFDYKLTINESGNNILKEELNDEIEEETTVNEQIINNESERSTREYKRKIFLNESLRNIMNRPDFSSNDFGEQSSSLEDEDDIYLNNPRADSQGSSGENFDEIQDNRNITKADIFERKESISVPVNVRRNSFLENMLSKDSDANWISCEIVAAHPETSSLIINDETVSENKIANRLNDSINKDPEIQQILQESKASLKKVDSSVLKSTKPALSSPSNEKNPGDIKCNVLNELLSNFNNIKLKPVKKNVVETLPRMTAIQQNEDEESVERNLENTRSLDSLHDKITEETSARSSDPKPKMLSFEQENEETLTFEVPNLNDYDNKIVEELPRESDSCVSKEDSKKMTRFSEEPSELSETNLYRATVIQNEDSLESLKETTDNQMSIENKIEVIEEPLKSEETDVTVDEREAVDGKDEESNSDRVEQLDLRSRRMFSGDKKSAIVRRIPCNNNDNNRAVTPVAVSDDQSRDTVTIIPGRVRSFVRYYEIRREATIDKDSKDKVDKIAGHQSVSSIRRGLEAKAKSSSTMDALETSVMEKNFESIGCTVNVDRFEDKKSDVEGPNDETKTDLSRKPCGDSYMQSSKTKRKKSVKFQGGFTVIGAKSPDKDDSSGSRDTRSGKKKAPDRPTLKRAIFSEKVDRQDAQELADDESRIEIRDVAAQIQGAAECKECSGINRFVPKPETPRLVFYCTV